MKNGREIADNLGRIYPFVLESLPRVTLYNDPVRARQAIELLAPRREAWSGLDGRGESGAMSVALDAAAIETACSERCGHASALIQTIDSHLDLAVRIRAHGPGCLHDC